MIIYTDINDITSCEKLKELCSCGGVCACRSICLADSYAAYPGLLEAWFQYDGNGDVCSSAVKYGGDMTVVLSEKSDIPELRDFILAAGAYSVISEVGIFPDSSHAIIMKRKRSRTAADGRCRHYPDVSLKDAYDLLKSCRSETFTIPQYEDFLLDASHRLRHGTAHCCALYEEEQPVSFAMTAALSETQAVIGSVCTAGEYRRRGCGSACINALCTLLGDRELFIVRAEGENKDFYRSLGFEQSGTDLYITNLQHSGYDPV